MNAMRHAAAAAVLSALLVGPVLAADEVRVYNVNAKTASYVPGDALDSYRQSGEGNASVGGTVGLGVNIDGKECTVQYTARIRDGALLADVTLRGDRWNDKRSELDLSDLKPQTIDLGEAADGRRFHVTFTPSVSRVRTEPKALADEAVVFGQWHFRSSPVIVNDAMYVGRLGGGGQVARFEISDIGSLEMSLEEIEGWRPWGVLKDGVVTIRRPDDQTTVEVLNAKNGPSNAAFTLPGGPFRVWVRWDDPRSTSAEDWEQLREQREKVIANGIDPQDPRVALIDKQLAREPSPWIVSCGFYDRKSNRRKD